MCVARAHITRDPREAAAGVSLPTLLLIWTEIAQVEGKVFLFVLETTETESNAGQGFPE